jgi:hypothetical protein
MGMVKNWQLAEAEDERWEEARSWLQDRLGRLPTEQEVAAAWSDFELAEAMNWSMDKDN